MSVPTVYCSGDRRWQPNVTGDSYVKIRGVIGPYRRLSRTDSQTMSSRPMRRTTPNISGPVMRKKDILETFLSAERDPVRLHCTSGFNPGCDSVTHHSQCSHKHGNLAGHRGIVRDLRIDLPEPGVARRGTTVEHGHRLVRHPGRNGG